MKRQIEIKRLLFPNKTVADWVSGTETTQLSLIKILRGQEARVENLKLV